MYITNSQLFYNQLKTGSATAEEYVLSEAQIQVIHSFSARKSPKTVVGKIRAVKTLIKGLVEKGLISPVKIRINLFGKGLASMLDNGTIILCGKLLFRQPYSESVLTVLHEVAHVKLGISENYQALKKCDAEFLAEYVKDASQTVICPIEYYANVISISWLEQVVVLLGDEALRGQLVAQIEHLKAKLEKAKEKV